MNKGILYMMMTALLISCVKNSYSQTFHLSGASVQFPEQIIKTKKHGPIYFDATRIDLQGYLELEKPDAYRIYSGRNEEKFQWMEVKTTVKKKKRNERVPCDYVVEVSLTLCDSEYHENRAKGPKRIITVPLVRGSLASDQATVLNYSSMQVYIGKYDEYYPKYTKSTKNRKIGKNKEQKPTIIVEFFFYDMKHGPFTGLEPGTLVYDVNMNTLHTVREEEEELKNTN